MKTVGDEEEEQSTLQKRGSLNKQSSARDITRAAEARQISLTSPTGIHCPAHHHPLPSPRPHTPWLGRSQSPRNEEKTLDPPV